MIHWVDWAVMLGTLAFIAIYGMYKTKSQNSLQSYYKGGDGENWYTVGLSVMATQASAITFLSATGQGYQSGLGFIQIYFGLPLAIIVVCTVFIPLYYKFGVFTAYEYLEKRFDLKTRLLTASLFLMSRAFAAGITIYAPSIVLSTLFSWDLALTNIAIGVLVTTYTAFGGSKAVSVTQKQQMTIILLGMLMAMGLIIFKLPKALDVSELVNLAAINGKLEAISFNPDLNQRYTIWSGLLGGFFLSLSYFGTDQSQVQRYINGKDLVQSRMGLIFNAILKIPMQFMILAIGVLMFIFYQFNATPIYFNQNEQKALHQSDYAAKAIELEQLHQQVVTQKIDAVQKAIANEQTDLTAYYQLQQQASQLEANYRALIKNSNPQSEGKDADYIFLSFVIKYFPVGIIGLLLAVILSAAMSSTSGELSALSSTVMIDYFKRLNPKLIENNPILWSKLTTAFWGLIAIGFALTANLFENLIQLVNIVGSLFYGTILGIFLAGILFKHLKSSAVFIAAIVAECLVIALYLFFEFSFLWLVPIGSFTVIFLALFLTPLFKNENNSID